MGVMSGSSFQLFIVYANLAMYAFCYQMQQPILPATVAKLVVGVSTSPSSTTIGSCAERLSAHTAKCLPPTPCHLPRVW